MSIGRGTTPENDFYYDEGETTDLSKSEVMYVTYKQGDEVVAEKEKEDCDFFDWGVRVRLSQEDTLKFHEFSPCKIQVRARYADGTAIISNIIDTTVDKILKDGVI